MRFHFSFHKCLTKYTGLSLNRVLNNLHMSKSRYRHFDSLKTDFMRESPNLNMASLNNHFIDDGELEGLSGEENTISLFTRDPRDLLVSGYFYHKKGVEPWTKIKTPVDDDYEVVNGCIPKALKETGMSMFQYLNQCSVSEGFLIELEFRRKHFESMENWLSVPRDNLLVLDYEKIMVSEERAFLQVAKHHRFNMVDTLGLAYFVNKYKAKKSAHNTHIRDPKPGQWKQKIPSASLQIVNDTYSNLISLYEKRHSNLD